MRPVNKGPTPYSKISHYSDALPFLVDKIGPYCSYCGFAIDHVPEVEHIAAKAAGGDLTAWDNLLLGCKYCNTRKSKLVGTLNADDYLWPDQYNTALAYQYDHGVPTINKAALSDADPSGNILRKAENLFDLVKLDHIPTPREKDRRFAKRNKIYETACESLERYQKFKETSPDHIDEFAKQIVVTATLGGFFSIWMSVFADEPTILNALLDAFPGTEKEFFEENGLPKPILECTQGTCAV